MLLLLLLRRCRRLLRLLRLELFERRRSRHNVREELKIVDAGNGSRYRSKKNPFILANHEETLFAVARACASGHGTPLPHTQVFIMQVFPRLALRPHDTMTLLGYVLDEHLLEKPPGFFFLVALLLKFF